MDKAFIPYLYTENSVSDMLEKYCQEQLASTNPINQMKARRLLNYWALLNDSTFLSKRIPQLFGELSQRLENRFPEIRYEILGRIKGLFSSLDKIEKIELQLLEELKIEFLKKRFPDYDEDFLTEKKFELEKGNRKIKKEFNDFILNYYFRSNPFIRLQDFFAFRIIIEDTYPKEYINEIYEITEGCLQFFVEKSFELMVKEPLIEIGTLEVKSDFIVLPNRTMNEEYRKYVKDYVAHPKKYGYQGLHFSCLDPFTGRYFEIQVRTRSMDMVAESLANHELYKQRKYKRCTNHDIDFSKIQVPGFRYFRYNIPNSNSEAEFISDYAGITKSIPLELKLHY